MKILVVNDDGIQSERIIDLAERLVKYGDVTICCPSKERSAASHSIDINGFSSENISQIQSNIRTFIHNNMPADGVRYMYEMLKEKFDFVFSGVNQGFNLGVDISYSGTVGAALEGAINNCKSVAISASKFNDNYKNHMDDLINYLIKEATYPYKGCLNVNIPDEVIHKEYIYAPMSLSYSKPKIDSDFIRCRKEGYITITKIGIDRTIFDN